MYAFPYSRSVNKFFYAVRQSCCTGDQLQHGCRDVVPVWRGDARHTQHHRRRQGREDICGRLEVEVEETSGGGNRFFL